MPETPRIPQLNQEQASTLPPRQERRAMAREGDMEAYGISLAAIEITKKDINPEAFTKSKESFNRFQRVARRELKDRRISEEQYADKLAEFHAATNVADSFDELTEAFDRPTIKKMVETGLQKPPIEGKAHIYLDLDINKLKAMNEESLNGHDSADKALAGFSRFHMGKLSGKFGYRARFGRISGDEFAIFVQNTTPEEIEKFFAEIEPLRQTEMHKIVESEKLPSDITAMRAMTIAQPGDTFEAMHARTDAALLAQKATRNHAQLQQVASAEA